jgi:chromodomain-helicase-DNA-binding protein 4
MFTQFVKPILQKENPKAATSKIMMLTAAKWREFCEENPNLQDENEEEAPEAEKSEEEEPEEEEPELEYKPKASRSRRGAEKQEEPEDSEEDTKKKKKGGSRSTKRGRKQKVPTLKIKFGKKKDQSSDEEKVKMQISPPNRDKTFDFHPLGQQRRQ